MDICGELGHEMVEAAPEVDIEAHSLATLRVWGANLANMMDGVATLLESTPSEDNLEAASWSKDDLPIGMQFAGRFADEATLLRLASQLEEARPWKDKQPAVHV